VSNISNANITRENVSQDNVLLACNMAETNNEDIWFLDFDCSNHMTGNLALFSSLDQSVKSQVTLGIDRKISLWEKEKSKYLQRKVKEKL